MDAGNKAILKEIGIHCSVFLGYLAISWGMMFLTPENSFPPFCMAFGFSLATVILLGLKVLPALWIGGGIVGYFAFQQSIFIGSLYSLLLVFELAIISFAYKLKFKNYRETFSNVTNVFRYLFWLLGVALIPSSMIAVAAMTLVMENWTWEGFPLIWLHWWAAELLGLLIFTPFILTWFLPSQERMTLLRAVHAIIVYTAVFLTCYFIFSSEVALRSYPLAFLILPLLGWTTLKLGRFDGLCALLLTAILSTWGTQLGVGPFSGNLSGLESLFILQIYLFVMALTTLILIGLQQESNTALEMSKESEERLKVVLQNMPVMMQAFDAEDNIIVWNRECERVTGYSADFIKRSEDPLATLYPDPEKRKALLENFHFIEGDYRGIDEELFCSNKTKRTISWSNISKEMPIEGWAGWAIGVDITERLQAVDGFRRSENRLSSIWDSIKEAAIIFDGEGRISDLNPRFKELFDCEEREVIGTKVDHYLGEGVFENFLSEVHGLPPHDFQGEIIGQRADGKEIPLEFSFGSFLNGDQLNFMGILRDVTLRKNLEQLAIQNHQLVREQLEQVQAELVEKTRFAALGQISMNVAHELRNPLGAVKSATYYLKGKVPQDQEKWREFLQLIDDEIDVAAIYIESLLDFSNPPDPKKEVIYFGRAIREVVENIDAMNTEIQIDPAVEEVEIFADYQQLKTILQHLISNAIQAQDGEGKIFISTRMERGYHLIEIQDYGLRIQPDIVQQMFEPLFSTKPKGAGLGLSISRQFSQAHGGTLEYQHVEGKGACFTIKIPGKDAVVFQGNEELSMSDNRISDYIH